MLTPGVGRFAIAFRPPHCRTLNNFLVLKRYLTVYAYIYIYIFLIFTILKWKSGHFEKY